MSLASSTAAAPVRSTDTSWLTPRSYMVTPNSRFMRAIVIVVGLFLAAYYFVTG